jgi:hypothetical protein
MKLPLLLLIALAASPAWGKTWSYRVFLDKREIGTHRFTLSDKGAGTRELLSEARFKLRVLGFPAYRYHHDATERWRDGCLESLVSRTDDNGEPHAVNWRAAGQCVMSFAYWNPEILSKKALLNAQTGVLEPVNVVEMGEERIETAGGAVNAKRYRVTGRKLAIDLWYAGGADWVALEANAGGRRLRYRLESPQ